MTATLAFPVDEVKGVIAVSASILAHQTKMQYKQHELVCGFQPTCCSMTSRRGQSFKALWAIMGKRLTIITHTTGTATTQSGGYNWLAS